MIRRTGMWCCLSGLLFVACDSNAPSSMNDVEAPTQLRATAVSPSQVELSWEDNSGNETGFRIERRLGTTIDEVQEVGANSSRFRDVSLTPLTTYSYRVAALNGATASAPTERVAVTTLPNDGPWQELGVEVSVNLQGVDFYGAALLSDSRAIVVGGSGTILRTTDAGETWVARQSGTGSPLRALFFVNPEIGTAVGGEAAADLSVVRRTRDGGDSWFEQSTPATLQSLRSVHFVHPDSGALAGTAGTLLITNNGGTNWVSRSPPTELDLAGVHFVDGRIGYAVGDQGGLFKTTDRGVAWQTIESGTTADLHGVAFADPKHGAIVGDFGTVLVTENGGTTWAEKDSGVEADLFAIQFVTVTTAFVVGEAGTILKSVDGGGSWRPQQSPRGNALFGLHFLDAERGLTVGEYGTVLQTRTGGE